MNEEELQQQIRHLIDEQLLQAIQLCTEGMALLDKRVSKLEEGVILLARSVQDLNSLALELTKIANAPSISSFNDFFSTVSGKKIENDGTIK